jgi:hypothetical protein
MTVIQTVEMVEIRLMNKRVSPTGQGGKKKKITPLAAEVAKIPTVRKIYSHGIHEGAKSEERSSADQRESYRLGVYEDIDVLNHSGERASRPKLLATVLIFRANDTDARDTVDNRVYLPMRAKSKKDGGGVPPTAQGTEKGEKDQESQHGLGRPSGGDADHNRVQKVEGNQEGRAPCVVLRYGCGCCVFAVVVWIRVVEMGGPYIVFARRRRVTRIGAGLSMW